jgi:hypothetical protein
MTRLTNRWTYTSAEAFGRSGVKGDQGEEFLCKVFEAWDWDYEHYSSSRLHQVRGIDVSFRKPGWAKSYTADVKSNLDTYGNFFVETSDEGWLFNPQKTSDRVWHVNPDTGWMAWYGRDEMKEFIDRMGARNTGLYKITARESLDFITRRRYNAN